MLLGIIAVSLSSCFNPFAPAIDETLGQQTGIISDRSDIEGIFRNLQYAYTFKDTLIYSQLLAENFNFMYMDYDRGYSDSWGRTEEMLATYGLFQNTQRLDLVWNNIYPQTSDSTRVNGSFGLTVTFSPTDFVYINGKVDFQLIKGADNKWQILRWEDKSNY